ncbi:MAG: hypothetical protein ACOCQQ_00980 [Candidatus Nanoarchaeia archaeon]
MVKKHTRKKKVENHSKMSVLIGSLAIVAVLLVISILTKGFGFISTPVSEDDVVVQDSLTFINENLLEGEVVAQLDNVSQEAGMYKLTVSVEGQPADVFVTKDGSYLFLQPINVAQVTQQSQPEQTPTQEPVDVVKSEKPVVELFVMSHCPFGTQAVKGILPAVEALGDSVDFEMKFVYYAMHGKTELDEQLTQECIKRQAPEKLNDYLKCFLASEAGSEANSKVCLTEVDIDETAIDACVAELDEEYQVTELYNDQSTWLSGQFPLFNVHKEENLAYEVGGSPTLVINEQQVNSGRSPADYLATMCASFTDDSRPAACDQELSSTTYSAGFGYDEGTATTATC